MKLAWLVWFKDCEGVESPVPELWYYPPDEDQWDIVRSVPITFQEMGIPNYV